MTQWRQNFEAGVTDGTDITTANSVGPAVTGFDSIVGLSGNVVYSTTQAHHQTFSCKISTGLTTNNPAVLWSTGIGALTDFYGRVYIYFTANPGGSIDLFTGNNGAGGSMRIRITNAGKLAILDGGNTQQAITTNSISLNQWVRYEFHTVCNASTGSVELKLFNTPDSTIATETINATNINTNTQADTYRFGMRTNSASVTAFYLDDIAIDSAAYPGVAPSMPRITHSLDSLITTAGTQTKSFIAGALLAKSRGKVSQIDALIGALVKQHAVDCFIGGVLLNNFNDGSQGTTITTGNSGGASGTAFTDVVIDAASTLTFDNTHPAHGSFGGKIVTATSVAGSTTVGWSGLALTSVYLREYFYIESLGNGNVKTITAFNNAGSIRFSLTLNTNGTVTAGDTIGAKATSSTTFSLNSLWRLEMHATAGATDGILEVKLFYNADSRTPDETLFVNTANTGAAFNKILFGSGGATKNLNMTIDDIGSSPFGYLGPAVLTTQYSIETMLQGPTSKSSFIDVYLANRSYFDSFTRTVSGGWGVPDAGSAGYEIDTNNSAFSVSSNLGNITVSPSTSGYLAYLPDIATQDFEIVGRVQTDNVAAGDSIHVYLVGRMASDSPSPTTYRAFISFNTDQTIDVGFWAVENNVETLIGSTNTTMTHAANTPIWVRARFESITPTKLFIKIWADGATEPLPWNLAIQDSSLANSQSSGRFGFGSHTSPSFTNGDIIVSYDNLTLNELTSNVVVAPFKPFTTNSIWNNKLPASTPKDSKSDSFIEFMKKDNKRKWLAVKSKDDDGRRNLPLFFTNINDTIYNVVAIGTVSLPAELTAVRIPALAQVDPYYHDLLVYEMTQQFMFRLNGALFSGGTWQANSAEVYYLDSNGLEGTLGGSNQPNNTGHRGIPPSIEIVEKSEGVYGKIDHMLKLSVGTTSDNFVFPMVSEAAPLPPQGIPRPKAPKPQWSVGGTIFTDLEIATNRTFDAIRDYVALKDTSSALNNIGNRRRLLSFKLLGKTGGEVLYYVEGNPPITSVTWAANVATVTCSTDHGFIRNQQVTLAGFSANPTVNGTWTVASVPSSSVYTLTMVISNPGTITTIGTGKVPGVTQGAYDSYIDYWANWSKTQPDFSLAIQHEPDHTPSGFTIRPGTPAEFILANEYFWNRWVAQGAGDNVWFGVCLNTGGRTDPSLYFSPNVHKFVASDAYFGANLPFITMATKFGTVMSFAIANGIDWCIWETDTQNPMSDSNQAQQWENWITEIPALDLPPWEFSLWAGNPTDTMKTDGSEPEKILAYTHLANSAFFTQPPVLPPVGYKPKGSGFTSRLGNSKAKLGAMALGREKVRTNGPSQGSRLRIKSDVDLTSKGLNATGLIIAQALKDYGAIIADESPTGIMELRLENTVVENQGNYWAGFVTEDMLSPLTLDDFEFIAEGFSGPVTSNKSSSIDVLLHTANILDALQLDPVCVGIRSIMYLSNNRMNDPIVTTTASNPVNENVLIDGIVEPSMQFAITDYSHKVDNFFRLFPPLSDSLISEEEPYLGNISDENGIVNETITLTYSKESMGNMVLVSSDSLSQGGGKIGYVDDLSIQILINNIWVEIATHISMPSDGSVLKLYHQDNGTWSTVINRNNAISITAIKLIIYGVFPDFESTSQVRFVELYEIDYRYEVDVSDDLLSVNIDKVRDLSAIEVSPIGTSAANTLTLTLSNLGNKYNNINSPTFAGMLTPNVVISVDVGIESEGTFIYYPQGIYYADNWDISEDTSQVVVSCRDGIKLLQDNVMPPTLYEGKLIHEVITDTVQRAGIPHFQIDQSALTLDDLAIGTSIVLNPDGTSGVALQNNIIWNQNGTYFDFLQQVATSDLGVFYFDDNGAFVYKVKETVFNSGSASLVAGELDDAVNIISADYSSELSVNDVTVDYSVPTMSSDPVQLFEADDPTVLSSTDLTQNVNIGDSVILVQDISDWQKSGFFKLDDEIIKYNDRTDTSFLECERGQFETTEVAHSINYSLDTYWDHDSIASWAVNNGLLEATSTSSNRSVALYLGDKYKISPSYIFSGKFRVNADPWSADIIVKADTKDTYYVIVINCYVDPSDPASGGSSDSNSAYIYRVTNNVATKVKASSAFKPFSNLWHDFQITVNGATFTVVVDNTTIFDAIKDKNETSRTQGKKSFGFGARNNGSTLPSVQPGNQYDDMTVVTLGEKGIGATLIVDDSFGKPIFEIRHFDVAFSSFPAKNINFLLSEQTRAEVISFNNDPFSAQMYIQNLSNGLTLIEGTHPETSLDNLQEFVIVTGNAVTSEAGQTITLENIININKYGRKSLSVQFPWVQSKTHAKELASYLLDVFSSTVSFLNVSAFIDPRWRLGDLVRVNYTQLGLVNAPYWVTEIHYTLGGGNVTQNLILRSKTKLKTTKTYSVDILKI